MDPPSSGLFIIVFFLPFLISCQSYPNNSRPGRSPIRGRVQSLCARTFGSTCICGGEKANIRDLLPPRITIALTQCNQHPRSHIQNGIDQPQTIFMHPHRSIHPRAHSLNAHSLNAHSLNTHSRQSFSILQVLLSSGRIDAKRVSCRPWCKYRQLIGQLIR